MPELTDILLYHVVGAAALSSDLSNGQTIATLNGEEVTVTINESGIFINDAQVIVADIVADNGVVHVIDAVLLPPTPEPVGTVVDVVVNSEVHNILEAAVIEADLAGALSGEGPFTVFAPTDAAIAALPAGALDALLAEVAREPDSDATRERTCQVISELRTSAEGQEGLASFLEKRRPAWAVTSSSSSNPSSTSPPSSTSKGSAS